MAEGAGLENRYRHPHIAGSNPALSAIYTSELVRGLPITMSTLWHIAGCSCYRGEVPERFNGHAWKACVGASSPQVRILSSPPFSLLPRAFGYRDRANQFLKAHSMLFVILNMP